MMSFASKLSEGLRFLAGDVDYYFVLSLSGERKLFVVVLRRGFVVYIVTSGNTLFDVSEYESDKEHDLAAL